MGGTGNLKPITPLTDAQAKQMSDLEQQKAGIRQIMADAQTNLAIAQKVYSDAMDKFRAENDPTLNDAISEFSTIQGKCAIELSKIEEAQRAIRVVEFNTVDVTTK